MLAAEKIRAQIKRSGIKNAYISKQAGITEVRMSRILSGKGRMTAEEFLKIVTVINMDLDAFREPCVYQAPRRSTTIYNSEIGVVHQSEGVRT